MMKQYHLDMPDVNAKSHDPKDMLQGVSLCGRGALTLLAKFPDFLALLTGSSKAAKAQHTNIVAAVKSFVKYWNTVSRPFDASNPKARGEKAKNLRDLGQAFVKGFKTATSASSCTYYMHLMMAEIPRLVMTCPVDVHLASGMAGEQVIMILCLVPQTFPCSRMSHKG